MLKTINLFKDFGYDTNDIDSKIENIWYEIFEGPNNFYYEVEDMGYIVDTGNVDVRTEGMSYGMMLAVQYDRQDVFDRLWKWTKKYMYLDSGVHENYFAWSVDPSGEKLSQGPAPDGEEYFAMTLFFAANRWGNKEGILNYSHHAQELLKYCLHKGTKYPGHSMWNLDNKLIKFVPEVEFTDPSYHLPHFYEYFSLWSYPEDSDFWKDAALASREYLKKAINPKTGLSPEYSTYEGQPQLDSEHPHFFSDAYRTVLNVAMDGEWFEKDPVLLDRLEKHQAFFADKTFDELNTIYSVEGKKISSPILHPVGLIATIASASISIPQSEHAKFWVDRFWNLDMAVGSRRYYDNFLYAFAFLLLSGQFKPYK